MEHRTRVTEAFGFPSAENPAGSGELERVEVVPRCKSYSSMADTLSFNANQNLPTRDDPEACSLSVPRFWRKWPVVERLALDDNRQPRRRNLSAALASAKVIQSSRSIAIVASAVQPDAEGVLPAN